MRFCNDCQKTFDEKLSVKVSMLRGMTEGPLTQDAKDRKAGLICPFCNGYNTFTCIEMENGDEAFISNTGNEVVEAILYYNQGTDRGMMLQAQNVDISQCPKFDLSLITEVLRDCQITSNPDIRVIDEYYNDLIKDKE